MILAIVLLLVAGIIYYSTHRIPPDPFFQQEVYVEENDFWDDMKEEDFDPTYYEQYHVFPEIPTVKRSNQSKTAAEQQLWQQEKKVAKRRKKRKIAKKSRQQNRTK